MDAGGDLLERNDISSKWWRVSREQNSYFFGNGNNLVFLNNDFNEPLDIGFGEAFRAFTKYLGWKTEYAGKLMALAGLVNFNPYSGVLDLFYLSKGRIKSKLESNPRQPIKMIKNFANKYSLVFPEPSSSKYNIEEYAQLANFMQTQYEKYLFIIIEDLYRKYKVNNLCISGGVGLNCVANGKIFENTSIKNVYIPPACGDQGQCMGNALFGISSKNRSHKRYPLDSAFLGPQYSFNKGLLSKLLQNKEQYTIDEEQVFYKVAYLLKTGKIGAVHNGRSEFGPRALGNRSILAEPFNLETKFKLNQIKQRESFNPFAICVPVEKSNEYFLCHSESPFMQFAFQVKPKYKSILKGIIHKDGSCRIQTIDKERNVHLYSIVKEFAKLTGHPIIINTSLNSNDEPICETIEQSINCFQKLNLDFLLINDVLIHKNQLIH
jgi:carbamoyltransferase